MDWLEPGLNATVARSSLIVALKSLGASCVPVVSAEQTLPEKQPRRAKE